MDALQVEEVVAQVLSQITNGLITATISLIVISGGTALAGYFVGKKRQKALAKKAKEEEQQKIEDARIIIEKATARRLIFEAHDKYCVQKQSMSIDRFREISETFTAYKTLGGNGTAQKYYDEISEISPTLVN